MAVTIDRASGNDVLQLATDVGPVPMQVGAVLVLDDGPALDGATLCGAMEARTRSVPRLRQRLVTAPPGCGRPIWVADESFAIDRQVHERACPAPGDEAALLAVAADLVTTRLPADRPLWSATWVSGVAGHGGALVVVFHHVLADGIGGLAVLANLVDGMPVPDAAPATPRPPGRWALFADGTRARLRAISNLRSGLRRIQEARTELGQGHGFKAAPCSLTRPTGPHRAFAVAHVPLAPVLDLAHRHGATVNDVVLSAVSGALAATLAERGESPVPAFVVSVPVSARRSTDATQLGNEVGVMPVAVPTVADPVERLRATTAARQRRQGGSAGASAAMLGPLFRLLARLGAFRWFIDRQRLVHTFVTNLRGPDSRFAFLDHEIARIVPMTSVAGNVTVAFAVLSYAGTLGITVVADPERCPDFVAVRDRLRSELDRLLVPDAVSGEPDCTSS